MQAMQIHRTVGRMPSIHANPGGPTGSSNLLRNLHG
jgi:hypothetical protein